MPAGPPSRARTGRTDLTVVGSGRGAGRSRPPNQAGRASSRPQARRGPAGRGVQSRGAQSRTGQPRGGPGRTPASAGGGRPRLTGRAAIVIVVLAVLLVSYATSLRAFLAQRSQIEDLETQIAQDRHAIADLREERRRWHDPAFIEAQARERFGWVHPGEIGLRVIGRNGRPISAPSRLTDPATLGEDPDAEWWSTAWSSIRGAGTVRRADDGPAEILGPGAEGSDEDPQGGGRAR
jgi:cell division protein FtsB